jgi:ribosomal protein L11 methyltransferase
MPWLQVHLITEQERAGLVAVLLENLGALSVTLGDAADSPLFEPAPGEQPLWSRTRITGLFPGDTDTDSLRQRINQALNRETTRDLSLEMLKDQVWERIWLDSFQPMRFGSRLWICPNGQRPEGESGIFIDLDPGLAFGTGTHPTTSLCLQWLDRHKIDGKRILDFGCGSGILAIAAIKLGASQAYALDHDPQALSATRDNAEKNGVSGRLCILSNGSDITAPVDMILANILAGTLIDLKPKIAGCIRPGGSIVLSGILASQSDDVMQAYAGDFRMCPPEQAEDWVLIEGLRL